MDSSKLSLQWRGFGACDYARSFAVDEAGGRIFALWTNQSISVIHLIPPSVIPQDDSVFQIQEHEPFIQGLRNTPICASHT